MKPGSEAKPERAKAEALAYLEARAILGGQKQARSFLDVIAELELMVASVNAFWFAKENGGLWAGERLLR